MTITLALAFGGLLAAVLAVLADVIHMLAGPEGNDDRV